MKKNVLIVLFLALFIAGCSSEKNSNTNPCTNVSDFTISQHNDIITFNFFSSETPKSEVSIINSNSPSEPDMGNLYSFVPNQLFSLTDLGLEIGNTYLFYTLRRFRDTTQQ